ncbi:MAG: hypothetical protein ABI780_10200, partial [Ardenticatenales bacterium]
RCRAMPTAADRAAAAHPLAVAEFQYLGQCAFQANEDRARAPQLFGVTLATVAAALYSSKLEGLDGATARLVFALLFASEAVVGALTLRQLARLRLSWLSAIRAQNTLLRQAVAADRTLDGWFLWLDEPMPPAYNHGSVGWLMAAGVSLLTGLTAAAVVFTGMSLVAVEFGVRSGPLVDTGGLVFLSAIALVIFGAIAFHHGYRLPLEQQDAKRSAADSSALSS